MKLINIMTHPYLVITSFFLILISGQSFGGFYLVYLIMALPYGGIHAILAILGVGVLLLAHELFSRKTRHLAFPLLNIAGIGLLGFSLLIFFANSKGYNNDSFHQPIPLITILIFVIMVVAFLTRTMYLFWRKSPPTSPGLRVQL